MSKDMLTQEEIEALLRQNELEKESAEEEKVDEALSIDETISPFEQDALGEIGNISFGSAATALSTLLGQKVDITTPQVILIRKEDVDQEFPSPHVAISVHFTTGFEGTNLLVMRIKDAAIIADLMMGGDGTNPSMEMSELYLSAVQEAMNQMMGSAATSMSTIFNRRVDISPPGIDMVDFPQGKGQEQLPEDDHLVKVSFRLRVGDLIDSKIMQLLPISFAQSMVDSLMNMEAESQSQGEVATTTASTSSVPASPQSAGTGMGQQAVHEPIAPHPQQPAPAMAASPAQPGQPVIQQQVMMSAPQGEQMYGELGRQNPQVQPVQFASLDTEVGPVGQRNLNLLLDIPLQVSVELGRTKRRIQEILELTNGSIIELDKLAGEPVDILVNNKLIAKGEVVVIDENFGVRVTDILSPMDRVQKLQ